MEYKQEISKIIDRLPNEVLNDLLHYLREVEKASEEKMRLSLHLKKILIEDKEVLQELAK